MKKMNFQLYKAILLMGSIAFFCSCEDDILGIGTDIIGGGNFETERKEFEVYAYNRKLSAVQTNGLPLYQLGVYNDPLYGKTEAQIVSQLALSSLRPTFGVVTQQREDEFANDGDDATTPENETVTEVYLNIPFFSRLAEGERETDDDGEAKARKYELDSIFGSKEASFNLRVSELTYYLRDLDPSSGFLEQQEYFSDKDFSAYTGLVLYDEQVTISNKEELIFRENNEDTEEDESKQVERRLTPRIRVPLNTENGFFQQILDKEGSDELLSQSNFKEFIKGLHFSASGFSEETMMLLDWNNANVEIVYTYDRVDTSNDNEIVQNTSSYTLNLTAFTTDANGVRSRMNNVVNPLVNDPYPSEIAEQLDTDQNASRLYLKGGAGTLVELRLFDTVEEGEVLEELRAKGWIINEANLTFYVDREKLDALQGLREPARIYVYNLDDNQVLADIPLDYTFNQNSALSRQIYGGILEEEDDKGIRYKIRVTEHIHQVLNEGATNVRLGLAVTASINNTRNISAGGDNGASSLNVPEAAVISPMGTVLYGSNVDEEDRDKRLKLEIYYTEID